MYFSSENGHLDHTSSLAQPVDAQQDDAAGMELPNMQPTNWESPALFVGAGTQQSSISIELYYRVT